ncbi:MAG: class I tRNA ligase family protein, partial [Clostridia bacterium]|nr:class I tRNA ligase family protein [Clostridia bacterium]
PWNDDGIKAIARFMDRVEKIVLKVDEYKAKKDEPFGTEEKALDYARNFAISRIAKDMEAFSFNTAIARLMELVNAIYKYDALAEKNLTLLKAAVKDLLLLLAPCAPHFAEELWEKTGDRNSVFEQAFPKENLAALQLDEKEYAIQVNSKIICKAMIASSYSKAEIEAFALALPEVQEKTAGKAVKKCVVVPGRLVNLIVG